MIATPCQRWTAGRATYRPANEPIRTADYDVAPIADDASARAFVVAHHYSGTYPAARRRFGLYRGGALVGVAVFSVPCNDRVLTASFPGVPPADGLELGRFVLRDDVPANGETWLLGRCFHALRREGFAGVVSFSDPCRRTNLYGETVFGGHLGVIYQAHNGVYLGRGTARTLSVLPDGQVFSDRAQQKVRARSKGWGYAVEQLRRHGADAPPEPTPVALADWLRRWRARLCRRQRHPGNHKYAWALARGVVLPRGLPYPKWPAASADLFSRRGG